MSTNDPRKGPDSIPGEAAETNALTLPVCAPDSGPSSATISLVTAAGEHPQDGSPPRFPEVPGYEILEELGRGGMGVVYKARQLGLSRIVALKMILSGSHAGEAERRRFRTEAEAIARFAHPNIVQVFEVGEADVGTGQPRPYMSLEFCSGGNLAQRLVGTPLLPLEAASLLESLARGIAAAHAAGVVHRDLKPANVMLASPHPQPPYKARFLQVK